MNLFESWRSLAHTAVAAAAAYVALVAFLRISGKRTLAKMNAFDLVVTVALGSTLASIATSDRLPLANGIVALALLVLLQYVVAWTTVRVPWLRRVVKSEPTLLYYGDAFLDQALRTSRVSRDEVLAAVRGEGVGRLAEVSAVVLESDGSFSVVRQAGGAPGPSSLRDVDRTRESATC